MRLVVIVALLTLFVVVTVRAVKRPDGPQWHGGSRWPWVTWTVVALIIIPTAYYEVQWYLTTRTLTGVAVKMTGREDAKVSCQRAGATMLFAGAEAGHVMWEESDERGTGSEVWLTYEMCRQLRTWLHTGKVHTDTKDAQALHVFTHELGHITGIKDEAVTECYALANDVEVFGLLGASPDVAKRVADRYAEEFYPRMPSNYRTNCTTVTLPPVH